MCRIVVDIQSAMAEIRRGKKEEQKIMSASAMQGNASTKFEVPYGYPFLSHEF